MPLPFTFGSVTTAQTGWLDSDFNAVGLLGTLPCTAVGTNVLTLTPIAAIGQPTPVLQSQLRFSALAANTNTGSVTANVAGLGLLNVYKDSPSGPVALTGSEIVVGNYFVLAYDPALNTGTGGYHLETAPANAAGTVTSVATGTGLTGGPVTTTGTISLASIASDTMLANATGSSAAPASTTLSAFLDAALGSPGQGAIISRGASLWAGATEASWTPSLTFGGAATGMAYATQVGFYMSIGFLIFAMYNITLSAVGSATGVAAISLPTAAGAGNRIGGGLVTNYANLTSVTTVPWTQIASGGSVGSLVVAGSGTVSALTNSNFGNTSVLAGLLLYLTG